MLERISKNTFEYPVKVLFGENNLANVVKNKKKILFPILLFAALGTSVAAFLKISRSYISRIEKKAIEKLKKNAKNLQIEM